jgi:uroporphyrinogen III methyltransferase / synthase
VVTRARDQARALSEPLEALGATVIAIPSIEIRPPDSWEALDRAIHRLDEFDFLIFTSVNGVRNFFARLHACGVDPDGLAALEVGAIGPATAQELGGRGVEVSFVPEEYRAEGLLEVLAGRDLAGKAFLIPRAKVARDLVPRVLAERGARVEVVEAYQTVAPDFSRTELSALLEPPPDLVVFTSSSTVSNFATLLATHSLSARLAGVALASIGPITSQTIAGLGWKAAVEAREFTIPGLVEAIRAYFEADAVAS